MNYYFIPVTLYVFFCMGFCLLSQNMDASDYRGGFWQLLQPCLLFVLFLYLTRTVVLGLPAGFLACAIGIITGFAFPLLYHLTHRGEPKAYSYEVDFAFGLFVSVLFVSLADVFLYWNHAAGTVLLTATEIIFLLPGIFQLSYYSYYRECVNEMAVQALFNTNKLEAKEFFRLIPAKLRFVLSGGFLLLAVGMFRTNLTAVTVDAYTAFPTVSFLIFLLTVFLLFGIGKIAFFRRTALGKMCIQVKEHMKRMQDSPLSGPDYPSHVTVESLINNNNSDFGTVLLVIGESANRLHMRAFSDYERETTPWLSEQANNNNFYLFPNSYATWIQTIETVTMALTNKNQYTKVPKEDEISIINIANKLGFKTYWFSAQGYSNSSSSEVTVIANASQDKHWLLQDYAARQYDEKLLAYLKTVDTKKNFIVVHLEGSHADFHLRYPAQFAKWSYDTKDPYGSNPYDNSILYTDHILSQLFAYAKEHLNLQTMIYFSDHGSLIGQQRKSSFSGFEDTRIPFCVYLSDEYKARFPNTALALRKHTTSYFTNDLIFDLLCGLFQITGSLHKEKNDISSMSYGFTRETLKTNLGKISLMEDLQTEVKVSVIMPAYNSEVYIRGSIDSVLAQSFTNFELIVVDDGSTDSTAQIVQSYTDARVRLIRLLKNQGVSVARNAGLEAAQGEFITFLDSDDLYYPDFLKTLYRLIQSNETEMVFSDFSESYHAEDMQTTDIGKIRCLIKDKLLGTRVLASDAQIDGLPVHINSVMLSKKLIEQYHLRFLPDVRLYEDGNFLFKAFLAAKKIYGTYICLEHYCRHSDSASFLLEGVKDATPIDLHENELKFAQKYGLNGEFIRRVKRYEAFKTLKIVWKQKNRNEAANYVKEHRAALSQFAETGERLNDRWICRLLLFLATGS